ncbi:dimethylsulfonioproprionate lyase family protein [Frigidibacter sp. RF13]|uniref:dimethylsulfonioproprionate lyase family protein n=1 Tax=Frigidibacter sp. RF13 TaxID=2997340 RepID=UPI0022703B16|nr:dimethylsulfonioproprionate lyase family protein [Frigidibacter sp. RF13]MCY1127839.1 dimethylsulfonioproprionate lyase family protein [Frigidibacter sp. RF13]
MTQDHRLETLRAALAALYRAEGRPEATRTAASLLAGVLAAEAQPPCALDALIRRTAATSPLPAARAVLAVQELVPWGTNPVADRTGSVADIIAVATLMSPEGPILSADFRLGLFYQRPDSYYPLHNHDADETYVILAGRADWTAGEDRLPRGPGDVIHHPSRMPHAFRTGPEGLLALWRWSGDINTHSYAILPDPDA